MSERPVLDLSDYEEDSEEPDLRLTQLYSLGGA